MFRILFHKTAEKKFSRLDKPTQNRIAKAIDAISINPKLGTALHGALKGSYRIRIGDFRVIYEIIEKEQIVLVHAIGSRGDIYK
ncbi:MAG: type II toxin-antitoxin system RelE/ParE family toxin [Candidatus Saganbacteria bacterium]|nr:type II toxin-antitoxin system RelE/ParE family toxin [Candidatus Saganbacteria bacterium]